MNEDVKSTGVHIHSRADELIACLEGEIAKRDVELERLRAKTRTTMGVGSGDGQLFIHGDYESVKAAQGIVIESDRLRAELAAIKAQEPVAFAFRYDDGSWHDVSATQHSAGMVSLYAAPVSEAKAHGVVMPERETELFNAAYGAAVESGWESVKCMARQIWDAARLNAAPAAPAADAGLVEALDRIARSAASHIEQGERPDLVTVSHWACVAFSAIDAREAV